MNNEFLRKVGLALAAPAIATVFAIAFSSLILVIAGSNPFAAYSDMIGHASKLETQIDILNRATPLYLAGVAAAIGFKMNLFNIGTEGQYLLAFLLAAAVGGAVSLPAVLHVALIFVVAMSVGAGYAGIAGVLQVSRGVNIVISTIMLNLIAVSGIIAWLLPHFQAGGEVSTRVNTEPIDDSGLLPNINSWVELFTRDIRQGKELTAVLVVAVIVGLVYYFLLNRTVFGYDLRASGSNPFAARVGGIPPKRMIIVSMLLSGGVAGLIGMTELMNGGVFPSNPIQGLGFAGIAVALLGRNNPAGIAFGALIFAFLDVSSGILQFTGAASREIVVIMQGVIILAAVVTYEIVRRYREREEAAAAAAALSGAAA